LPWWWRWDSRLAAMDAGINLIDTAECYGDHLAERLIGEAIAGQREKWIVATKFGHKFHDRFERSQLFGAKDVVHQLEESLKALKTDYVDLYQFHSGGDELFDNDELWETPGREVEKGKVRHLGVSIGSIQNIHQTDKATEVGASAIQVVYNRLQRQPKEKFLPSCKRQNLGVLARVPLSSGFLSGKYKPGASFPETDVRGKWMQDGLDDKLAEVERIQREEVPEGIPMAQWALAWCLRREVVTTVIPGCKNVEQVRSNASAADLLDRCGEEERRG